MRSLKKFIFPFFIFALWLLPYTPYHSANCVEASEQIQLEPGFEKTIKDEIALLNAEQTVSIASKMEEDADKAPSIITVVTANEIENLGARTLTDVLATVPGFDIKKDALIGVMEYGVRGMRASVEKIRVYVDGHSLNMPLDGSASLFFDDLSMKNVKKIEIVRGPGSAMYGANAFLAVINIITKDGADIAGYEASAGFGSHDTQEYSVSYGDNIYGVDVAGFVDFYNSNGLSDTIKQDALSGLPLFGQFSVTPGDTDDSRNKLDLNLKITYKDLKFNAKYMNKDTEPFVGSQFVLTDDSEQKYNYAMVDISYKLKLGERLTIKPKVYYDQYDIEFSEELFPDGFTIPFDLDRDGDIEMFPDGSSFDNLFTNRRIGGEAQVDYELFDNNTFTLGFNYEWERQDNVEFYTNTDTFSGASLGSDQKLSELSAAPEALRQIWAIYIQDKWDITRDLGLTFGIRHDHYSDFEGTTNPRIGLVWDFMDNAALKLLYGQAFRAPTFLELYTANNSVLLGDSDLRPETVRTYELGVSYKFNSKINAGVNYFFNVVRDEIVEGPKQSSLEPQVFTNLAGSNIQGIEFELKVDIAKNMYAFANYTYLDSETKGDSQPDVPKHKANIGFNVGLWEHFNANIHTFISDKRPREQDDERDDSPGYAIFNFTLGAKELFKGLGFKASLFNLLDKEYNDPSLINTVPTDLPKPGRTFFLEMNYKF